MINYYVKPMEQILLREVVITLFHQHNLFHCYQKANHLKFIHFNMQLAVM